MSGGSIGDYDYYKFMYMAEELEILSMAGDPYLDPRLNPLFFQISQLMFLSARLAKEVDYYASGDTGIESFLERCNNAVKMYKDANEGNLRI